VVVILAIISVIAVPHMSTGRTDAVASSLAASVTHVTMVLDVQHQKTPDGGWPESIEPDWFNSRVIPRHPDQMAGVPAIQVVDKPGLMHPRDKIIVSNSLGAYWYNAANGTFRARVKSLESVAETLAFYNKVNQSGLDTLGSGGGAAEQIEGGERVSAGDGGAALR
jgi:hypothetical protein